MSRHARAEPRDAESRRYADAGCPCRRTRSHTVNVTHCTVTVRLYMCHTRRSEPDSTVHGSCQIWFHRFSGSARGRTVPQPSPHADTAIRAAVHAASRLIRALSPRMYFYGHYGQTRKIFREHLGVPPNTAPHIGPWARHHIRSLIGCALFGLRLRGRSTLGVLTLNRITRVAAQPAIGGRGLQQTPYAASSGGAPPGTDRTRPPSPRPPEVVAPPGRVHIAHGHS